MELLDDIKLLRVAKVKCLRSLEFHTRYFFLKQFKRKFVVGDHHHIIWEALERVLRGECLRLIINIAPRYGKTETAVKALISHGLALNPKAKFIHLSFSDSLALDNSEMVKDLVQSVEYQTLFPEVIVKRDSRAKNKWWTTEGGGVLARSAAGAVTGFGAGQVDEEDDDITEWLGGMNVDAAPLSNLEKKMLFGGCIILDDPGKPDEADSEVIRERINQRFDSTIRTRVNSRNTPIVVIMQRTHPRDLAGYLQRIEEPDKWEVISLPCMKEDGTALWPFKHTVEELKKLQTSNDLVYERQYQQNPKPKSGLLFPIQDLRFFDPNNIDLHDPDFTYICADPADEGGDDFAAGPFKLVGDRIYLTDVLYNTEGADFNDPAVVKMVLQHKASDVGIESTFGFNETAQKIRSELVEKNYQGEFRILRPRTSKHSRILNRSSFIRNNFYFREDYADYPQYAKFMRILTSYMRIQEPGKSNKHDDAPDLCEMAASYYQKHFAHLWETK